VLRSDVTRGQLTGEVVEVEVLRTAKRVVVTARSEEAVASASIGVGRLGDGRFDGTIGERRRHVSREVLRLPEAVMSADTYPAPPPPRAPLARRVRRKLGRVRRRLRSRSSR
jgi:hypothetical protein